MYARRVSLSIAASMPVGHCGTLVIAIGKKKRRKKLNKHKKNPDVKPSTERKGLRPPRAPSKVGQRPSALQEASGPSILGR